MSRLPPVEARNLARDANEFIGAAQKVFEKTGYKISQEIARRNFMQKYKNEYATEFGPIQKMNKEYKRKRNKKEEAQNRTLTKWGKEQVARLKDVEGFKDNQTSWEAIWCPYEIHIW